MSNTEGVHYRLSKESDKEQIESLVNKCFGTWSVPKVFDSNLTGRYLLATHKGQIIAMTGLYYSSEYRAFEIDWTCTHPDYRCKGIMTKLFGSMLAMTDENIYCSCWRIKGSDRVNLQSQMNKFGFKLVIMNRTGFALGHNCYNTKESCSECCGDGCYCGESLYLRKGK